MKRRHVIRDAAVVVLLLGPLVTGDPARAAGKKHIIGFSQATMNHPHRVAMATVNRTYAQEHYPDAEFIMTDAADSASKQVADVESLMARGISVLMISPVTAQVLTPVVKQVMGAGIPVVTMDRRVNTPVTVHIGADNRDIGRKAGAYVAEALGANARIIEVQGTAGASPTIDRGEGFHETIAKVSGARILATQHCEYRREPAQKFMEDMLQRFAPGQFNCVFAHNDEMALGAIQALKAAGRSNGVTVVGIDGQEEAFKAIAARRMSATVVYSYIAPEGPRALGPIVDGWVIRHSGEGAAFAAG